MEQENELDDCKRRIEELEGRLEESDASVERGKHAAEKIDGLDTQLEASKKHFDNAKIEASSQIDELEKQLKDSDRCLEEQEKTSSHEIGNLQQQLRDGNEELRTLKTANSKDSEDVDHLRQEVQEWASNSLTAGQKTTLESLNCCSKTRSDLERQRVQMLRLRSKLDGLWSRLAILTSN